jgi:DNA-directed RNA polymerase specialized sigma24 family protein
MYHYVLAWTGEQATAVDLTTSVLRTAVGRMDQLVDGADADELEVRLMALLRASVIKRQARSGRPPAPTAVPEESMGLFEALGQLDGTQREVLVLCDLLGQDPDRAARLLGCDREVLDGLREAGAESLWRAMNDAPEDAAVSTWQRLTVGAALRQVAADWLHPAGGAVLAYVSERLFGEAPVGVPAAPTRRGAPKPAPAAPAAAVNPSPVKAPAAAAAKAPALPTRLANKPAAAAAEDGEQGPREPSPAAIAKANAKVGPKAAAAAAALAKGRAAATPAGAPPKPAAAKAAAELGGPAAAKAAAAPRAEAATSRADPEAQSKAAPRLQPRTGADGQPPATGNGRAKGDGGAAAAAAVAAAAGRGTQQAKGATTGEQPRDAKASGGALAALVWPRGRWAAWGVAAVAAAVLGVVAALTMGGPVSGSPDCPSALSCLPSTTLSANGRNTLPPGPPPTDAAGNLVPTSSLAGGGFVPAPGFPLVNGTSQTTTTGPEGRVPTTTSGTATTARPPRTTKPPGPTSPPTTAGPTTTQDTTPPTTAGPTTSSDTTTPPLPLP